MKGRDAGKDLVKCDAERVEIASGIDRAVHPAGLFRGHVGERSGDFLGWFGCLPLAGQPRRDAEAREPDPFIGAADQNVGRLYILVDEAALMDLAQGRSDVDREPQESVSNSQGEPSSLARGSPPGSSSTSMVWPRSRSNSSGRTAHSASSSSFKPYS